MNVTRINSRSVKVLAVPVMCLILLILHFTSVCIHDHSDKPFKPFLCILDDIMISQNDITLDMPKEVKNVVPLWPNITKDKCIRNIKLKPRRMFTTHENYSFYACVERNSNVKRVVKDSINRLNLDKNIIISYFGIFKMRPAPTIIEIGGYLGVMMPKLMEATGAKHYVALEPVPSFYKNFTEKIKELQLYSTVKAYNFGLAVTQKELQIGIHSDATSLLKDKIGKDRKTETIKIYKVIDFFVQIGLGCNSLNLLTINCEGCEFDVIEMLTSTLLINNIEYIQFQPHRSVFSNDRVYICRYCRLRQLLARTHEIGYEFPNVWETWKRKDLVS
ncbi:uncharacterized protein LOC128173767 [Crassostrea angulata]|uniref:uncharacterized protein LOC128173767 n=1 Tax=Magallana angulata TaxID=2784310 RepID=UPI0022B149E2|nr:uncharacterized protein LOC128173767 [Crassostrea angulata]